MGQRSGLALVAAMTVMAVTAFGGTAHDTAPGKSVGSAGVRITVPDAWRSIPQRPAIPDSGVVEPVARIVTASGRISFGRGCNQLDYVIPATAVGLVLVEWVRPTPRVTWMPRPRRFTEQNLPVRRGLLECFGRGGSVQFADKGRRFAAYVLAGAQASPASVRRARAVLDTLHLCRAARHSAG